nr:MYXO-CTERM sorting domain-containing protein [Corallococcus exiguus]
MELDAGAEPDAGTESDAGTKPDAGVPPIPEPGGTGCGCAAGSGVPVSAVWGLLGLLGAMAARRRSIS